MTCPTWNTRNQQYANNKVRQEQGYGSDTLTSKCFRVLPMEPIRFHREHLGRYLRLMERFFFHQEHPITATDW